MADSTYPIILTCQDPFVKKVSPLKKKSELVELKSISNEEIISKLEEIAKAEKVEYDADSLKIIAEHSQGDLRAAINDMQMLATGNKKLDATMLQGMDERLKNEDMQSALKEVFKATHIEDAIGAFDNVPDSFDDIFLWVDYNMPFEYQKTADKARAYGMIAKADVFRRRIRRRQDWRLLVYVSFLLSAGVSSAKESVYYDEIEYKQTSRLLKIWSINMKYAKRQAIAEKIAHAIHSSKKDVIKNFDYYKIICKQPSVAEQLELDKDEIAFLAKI